MVISADLLRGYTDAVILRRLERKTATDTRSARKLQTSAAAGWS